MSALFSVFIPTAKGLEYLLEEELAEFGITPTKLSNQGAYCELTLAKFYELSFKTRLGSRTLIKLFDCEALEKESVYQATLTFAWQEHFNENNTFSIEFRGQNTLFRNSMYGAQLIKDGLCDAFSQKTSIRPSVDKLNPDIRLIAYLKHKTLTVYLDPLGHPLHKRGYRSQTGLAPLKETLAAALLKRAKFDKEDHKNFGLIDPCCGSGTLLIEGAMMALKVPPGLIATSNNLIHWKQHNTSLYREIKEELSEKLALAKTQTIAPIIGFDQSASAIAKAKENVERAGLSDFIQLKQRCLKDFSRPLSLEHGLLLTNPPYGERLEEKLALIPTYEALGAAFQMLPEGFNCGILSSEQMLAKATNLRAIKKYSLYNGALPCTLYLMESKRVSKEHDSSDSPVIDSPLFNRLRKNQKKLASWVKSKNIEAYRVYDADLPEYSAAIDVYKDFCLIQEYRAPKEIPPEKAEARLLDILKTVPKALGVSEKKLILKQRKRQSGKAQYQKNSSDNKRLTLQEGRIQCYANLHDYLDTGLFLDHRPLRLSFAQNKAKSFLNLYCYTAVASLHASSTGAKTTNVDLSKTYLNWAKDNFALNKFDLQNHQFINQDVEAYLGQCQEKFEVIFLDPPSFSNSKKTENTLDVCRDHAKLIRLAMKCLKPGGTLYFSCNAKKFKLNHELSSEFNVTDITRESIDKDFNLKKPPHVCFKITHLN